MMMGNKNDEKPLHFPCHPPPRTLSATFGGGGTFRDSKLSYKKSRGYDIQSISGLFFFNEKNHKLRTQKTILTFFCCNFELPFCQNTFTTSGNSATILCEKPISPLIFDFGKFPIISPLSFFPIIVFYPSFFLDCNRISPKSCRPSVAVKKEDLPPHYITPPPGFQQFRAAFIFICDIHLYMKSVLIILYAFVFQFHFHHFLCLPITWPFLWVSSGQFLPRLIWGRRAVLPCGGVGAGAAPLPPRGCVAGDAGPRPGGQHGGAAGASLLGCRLTRNHRPRRTGAGETTTRAQNCNGI